MTTPVTPAARASAGATGSTKTRRAGALIPPPTAITSAPFQVSGAGAASDAALANGLDSRPVAAPVGSKLKFTVTVAITGTARPFSSVGVYRHWWMAVSAASSSSGMLFKIFASLTDPSAAITASAMTTPCTRASRARSG